MAVCHSFTEEGGGERLVEVGELAGGWVGCRKKGKQGTSFLFFILDVRSYLLPHCSAVGVCQRRAVAVVLLGRGGGGVDRESF